PVKISAGPVLAPLSVAINGKRTRLDAEALVQMLAAMPEGNLQRIELINNPPASYDADGDGGVINLVLIENDERGVNGQLNVFGGYGQRGKYGASGNFNWKRGGLHLFGNFSTDHNHTNQDFELRSRIQYPNQQLDSRQDNRRPAYIGMHSGRIGADLELGAKASWSTFVAGSLRRWDLANARASTDYFVPFSNIDRIELTSQEINNTDHYMVSNHFTYRFNTDQKLSVDYDYLSYFIDNPTNYQSLTFRAGETESSRFESTKETPLRFHVARVDYEAPWGGSVRWQAGAKATLADLANDTRLSYLSPVAFDDPLFTDRITMREDILAAYLSAEGNWSPRWGFRAGLRFEYSNSVLDSDRDGPLIDRDLSRLFPSLSINYQLGETNKLTLSYNERINRPSFQTLAPAFYFFDINSILAGNFNTLPGISRSAQVDLSLGTWLLSLAYTDEQNPISWGQPDIDRERKLLILSPRNINRRQTLGANLSFPLTFTKFWSSRYNFNGFWQRDQPLLDGQVIEVSAFNGTANLTQTFRFADSWEAEFTSRWNSRINNGLTYWRARVSFGMGLQKQFKNGAKLALSWYDLFDTGSFFGLTADQPDFFYDWNYDLEGNIVRLSFSTPFGNQKLKTRAPRRAGSEEVQRRANN
ncbi:MAG: outer membrane beta-barrel family protein, partial [Bacteroidota bacterium]